MSGSGISMPRTTPAVEGYLLKQSAWLHTWRSRYFKLIGSKLYFSRGPHDEPHGVIDLSSCLTVKSADDKTGKAYSFEIATPDQVFFLVAPTEADKNNFIGHVGRAVVQHSGSGVTASLSRSVAAAAAADDEDFDEEEEAEAAAAAARGRRAAPATTAAGGRR